MKKSKVNNENFISIQGWMVNELGLKGSELIIYAIIYGFSQDGQSKFTGSLQYLADWTNSSKQNCMNHLKSLLEKKLIEKEDIEINNIKYCRYNAKLNTIQNFCIGSKNFCIGSKNFLPNNIEDNIEDINTNNINIISMQKSDTPFDERLNKHEEEPKKKTKTQKQINAMKINKILEVFVRDNRIDEDVEKELWNYLNVRKLKGLVPEQWQELLNEFYIAFKDKSIELQKQQVHKATLRSWTQLTYADNFEGKPKVTYSNKPSFDNTADHNIPKGVASMTPEERKVYEENELAKDENGNYIKF